MDNMPTLAEYIARQAGVPGASCPNLPNTYIGMRYVPEFADPVEWDATMQTEYEYLKIVTYQGNSYTSRTWVPKNIPITNTDYWILTGNYNAQVEAYRKEVQAFDGRITDNTAAIAQLQTEWQEYTNHSNSVNIKYPPIGYVAATGDGETDDTAAIQKMLNDFGAIYVPRGVYKITSTLAADTVSIVGEANAWFEMTPSTVSDCIMNIGRTSYIHGMSFRFTEILPGTSRDQLIALKLFGAQWGLQRASLIDNCRFGMCGTAINGNPFSVTISACEMYSFAWSAIDIGKSGTNGNTQNVLSNIYISGALPGATHGIRIENYSNNSLDCINIEHSLFSGAALYTAKTTCITIGSIHFEGIGITSNYNAYLVSDGGQIKIDTISALYTRNVNSEGQAVIGLGTPNVPWGTWNYMLPTLTVNNFIAGGICTPNAGMYPDEQQDMGIANKTNFNFIYAGNQTPVWKVRLNALTLWTTVNDTETYRKFPTAFSLQWEYFPSMPIYGNTASRPTGEMLPPYSAKYFDTEIKKELIWNGTSWIPIIPETT